MKSRTVKDLIDSVRHQLRVERERGYRRGLKHAGMMPQSIELAVDKDQQWITTGRDADQ